MAITNRRSQVSMESIRTVLVRRSLLISDHIQLCAISSLTLELKNNNNKRDHAIYLKFYISRTYFRNQFNINPKRETDPLNEVPACSQGEEKSDNDINNHTIWSLNF